MDARSAELAIEALLLASAGPVPAETLQASLPDCDVMAAVGALERFWSGRGMRVERGRDGIRLLPEPDVAASLALAEGKRGRHLSEAAVATLSVIAMHQPVTLLDIERLRGVRISRGIIDALLDSGLVRVALRRSDAGRAATYVTTEAFLEHYSLGALTDLPTPEEIVDLVDPPSD